MQNIWAFCFDSSPRVILLCKSPAKVSCMVEVRGNICAPFVRHPPNGEDRSNRLPIPPRCGD